MVKKWGMNQMQRHRGLFYRYKIESNEYVNGKFHIVGAFVQENSPSDALRAKLMRGGIPQELLKRFERKEDSVKV